ncbi:CoA-transferase family III domain-containing protein [Bipolaris maydis]|nr:CoA-transferase family III domain-containing protein [Bipolaris maydis]KAJ6278053.1 CoA-transferase family III domain-containing protein [Bipolaris maydis]
MVAAVEYSIPKEAQSVFENGILQNPLMNDLPAEVQGLSKFVRFEGSNNPSIPINWRFAESISALKAFEGVMLNNLLTKKYKIDPVEMTINTDHASLFFMSPVVSQLIKDGKPVPIGPLSEEVARLFPNQDKHRSLANLHRSLATNIYKTKDGRFYHLHGSMNPDPTLTALGLPLDGEPNDTMESVVERIQSVVSKIDSAALDELMNEKYRQAGTIAWSSEEYFASEHGQKNGRTGLYEIKKDAASSQPASWWPDHKSHPSSPKRPLAGLKVVDLTRVIAGPCISRSLAEMGASVMRVTSPHITDLSPVHQDLNWGKWNCYLHLKDDGDKEKLRELILQADVVVDGYRPGVMERLGFGRSAVFDLVKGRDRGILHVRENCYGWQGPWSHRSGWQQISDACCGVSLSFGKAMGHDEPVTPVFPNSDYCTGVCGSAAVLDALSKRAEIGGSYGVDVALNYYSQWLVRSCGTYPTDVWDKLWSKHGSPVFRHYHAMQFSVPVILKLLYQHDAKVLFNQSFFESRRASHLGATFIQVKPVIQFPNQDVELKYQVGTRGNGADKPIWPDDLTVEVVE